MEVLWFSLMFEKKKDLRIVGIISKPHGIHGEVILNLITDYPYSIVKGTIFYIDEENDKYLEVESIRSIDLNTKNSAIIKFKNIENRDDAQKIKGLNLFRHESFAPNLKEEEFWVDDLIGCSVYTKENGYIGKVKDVAKNIANDNILIKRDANSIEIKGIKEKEFFIPLIDEYIDVIDTKEKKIILKKNPEYI